MSLSDWFKLARAEHGVLVLIGVAASAWHSGSNNPAFWVWAGLGPMLVTWSAFILNDYFDIPTDKAMRRKDRPLVSGKIAPSDALAVGVTLLVLGILQSSLVSPSAFALCTLFGVLSVAYSVVLKKLPLVGNLFIGLSMGIPILYGNWAVTPVLGVSSVIFAVAAFFIGLGRELLITLRDVKGDRKVGARTLPMMLGPQKTTYVASLFLLTGLGVAATPAVVTSNAAYIVFLQLASFLIWLTIQQTLAHPALPTLRRARQWTLLALACGLFAYVSLAF